MKIGFFKKTTVFVSVLAAAATLMSLTASAAPLTRDTVKGYAKSIPSKNDPGVLTYEDFEKSTKDEDGRIGKFSATVPDDTSINPATLEVVSGVSHSGSKSLKVSARGKNGNGDPQGYNTVAYKDIGIDIAEKFKKDPANPNKTDTYFISAWVRNVDPKVTQYFWLQMQYGGSGEVWLPGQSYSEVTGDKWTQIGIVVAKDKTYYLPFIEDTTKSGVYAPRNGVSTWSALKFITKNPKNDPKDTNEKVIQTNYDFYVDDIVIWKVDNASKLIAELPTDSTGTTTKAPPAGSKTTTTKADSDKTTTSNGQTTDSSASTTDSTAASETTENTDSNDITTTTADTQVGGEDPIDNDSNAGMVILIIIAAVVVLGGGGFCLYWFKLRKTA